MNIDLKHGDCVDVLKAMKEESVGSVICDPPYGLSFMGKDFDKLGNGESQQLWHRDWLNEAYRVLQGGGIIKAFSGTRTFHRLAAAMEQAGFVDVRLEAWTYGSGFPKSLNIGKAIDKAAGVEREVVGSYDPRSKFDGKKRESRAISENWRQMEGRDNPEDRMDWSEALITAPSTEEAKLWDGWGTALKPAWEPVLVGRKPTL